MKLSLLSLIATVGLAFTQVGASPIRVEIIARPAGDVSPFRFGHAAAHASPHVAQISEIHAFSGGAPKAMHHGGRKKKGCMRSKAINIANWMRAQLGLPLIETGKLAGPDGAHPRVGVTTITHIIPVVDGPTAPGGHIRYHKMAQHRNFLGRLHHALMILGPWEGRILAFVIGCGIGSLLRMFWVLAVVSFRSFSPSAREEVVDIVFDESEDSTLPPPKYIDEKVDLVE